MAICFPFINDLHDFFRAGNKSFTCTLKKKKKKLIIAFQSSVPELLKGNWTETYEQQAGQSFIWKVTPFGTQIDNQDSVAFCLIGFISHE